MRTSRKPAPATTGTSSTARVSRQAVPPWPRVRGRFPAARPSSRPTTTRTSQVARPASPVPGRPYPTRPATARCASRTAIPAVSVRAARSFQQYLSHGPGVQITFKTVTYRGDSGGAGGDGADGISFYLMDRRQGRGHRLMGWKYWLHLLQHEPPVLKTDWWAAISVSGSRRVRQLSSTARA